MSSQIGTFMQLDDAGVMKAFKDLGELTRKDAATIIIEHAVMLGRYLAESTAPFTETTYKPGVETPDSLRRFDGGSKYARMAGENATARDIGRVYKSSHMARDQMKQRGTEGEAMAKAFGGMIRKRDIAGAQALLKRSGIPMRGLQLAMFDGGEKHRRMRDSRGRINKGTAPTLIIDFGMIPKYKKIIKGNVGYGKSAWVNAARQISTLGLGQINGWIKNKSGSGTGIDATRNTNYPTIYLTNNVSWITKAMTPSFMANAHESFGRSVRAQAYEAADKIIKKHNL